MLQKIFDKTVLYKFLNKLDSIIFKIKSKFYTYSQPSFMFVSGIKSRAWFKYPFTHLPKEIPCNSADYCCAIDMLKKNITVSNTCVFIDSAFFSCGDNQRNNMPAECTESEYYDTLKSFFDVIEKMTGLKIIVSAHPKDTISCEKLSLLYGRTCQRGNTVELIAQSQLVVNLYSTAINYAIIFKKPILFVSFKEIIGKRTYYYTKAIADFLEQQVIIINDDKQMKALFPINLSINKDAYSKYIRNYIREPGAQPEKKFGEALIEAISQI
jgi:hypothetical protein